MGPVSPTTQRLKFKEAEDKIAQRFPFSTQEAFEQGLKKFTPIVPEEGFIEQLTDGRVSGKVGLTGEESDDVTPEGSVEFKSKGQNFDITFKNPGKYLEDLYLEYTKETSENKETSDFGTYITKDLTRRIAGKLNIDPKKHNAYISQITASIRQQENKLITDLQEAATKNNIVKASVTSDWGTGKITFSHKQENPQGSKTRNTREIEARQNIGGIDFSGKARYGPDRDSRRFEVKARKDGTELGYKHDRSGRTINRKFSGRTRLGDVDAAVFYGVNTDDKSREYEGELVHDKSGVRLGGGLGYTPYMNTLRLSLAKKLNLFDGQHEASLGWERNEDNTGYSTQTFTGGVEGSLGDKNPLTYGLEGHYTPKTTIDGDHYKKDYGLRARLEYKFDKGGFVEAPVDQQLSEVGGIESAVGPVTAGDVQENGAIENRDDSLENIVKNLLKNKRSLEDFERIGSVESKPENNRYTVPPNFRKYDLTSLRPSMWDRSEKGITYRAQIALDILGHKNLSGQPLRIDGKFGSNTKAAIKQWQKSIGETETGNIDGKQLSQLEKQAKISSIADEYSHPERITIDKKTLQPLINLGVKEKEIRAIIEGETTKGLPLEYSKQEKNVGQTSSATGLFQFIRSTAKELGTTTEKIVHMSIPEQVNLYVKYLKKYKWKPGIPLGLMQAAPSKVREIANSTKDKTIDIDKPEFLNMVIFTPGTQGYRLNLGWVPKDKNGKRISGANITLGSIRDYYE